KELIRIREAMLIWKLLKKRDEDSLTPHFVWDQTNENVWWVRYWSFNDSYNKFARDDFSVGETTPGGVWEKLKGRDDFVAAQMYVMHVVNGQFDAHSLSSIAWNEDSKRLNRVYYPKDLLGAIWLQFEQTMTGNGDYRECPVCGEWFDVSGFHKRTDKIY